MNGAVGQKCPRDLQRGGKRRQILRSTSSRRTLSQVINITMALEEPNSVNQLIPATASTCPAFARSPTDQSPVPKNSARKPRKLHRQHPLRTLWMDNVPAKWQSKYIFSIFKKKGISPKTIMRSAELEAGPPTRRIEFRTFADARRALSFNGKSAESQPEKEKEPIIVDVIEKHNSNRTLWLKGVPFDWDPNMINCVFNRAGFLLVTLATVASKTQTRMYGIEFETFKDAQLALSEMNGRIYPYGDSEIFIKLSIPYDASPTKFAGGRLTDTVSRQDALRTLWIRNLPPGWSITKISSYLEGEGFKLVSVIQPNYEGRNVNFCVEVETHEEAKKAVAILNETPVPNEESEVLFDTCLAFDCPGFAYTLVIMNLPDDCSVLDVFDAFKKYPSFLGADVERDSKGYPNGRAWIEYGDVQDWRSAYMVFNHLRISEFVYLHLRMDVKYAAHDRKKSLTPSPEQLTHFERKSITPAPIEHEIRKDRATYTPTSQYPLTPLENDPQRLDSTPPNQANAENRMSDDPTAQSSTTSQGINPEQHVHNSASPIRVYPVEWMTEHPWPKLLSTQHGFAPALERSFNSWLQFCQAESEKRMKGRSRPQITLAIPIEEPESPNEYFDFPGPLNQSTPIKRTTDPSTAQHKEDPQPSIFLKSVLLETEMPPFSDSLCLISLLRSPKMLCMRTDGVSKTAVVTFGDRSECEVAYMVNRNAVLCSRKLGIHFDADPVGTESNKALIPVADRSPETSLVPLDPHLRDYQPENDAAPLFNPMRAFHAPHTVKDLFVVPPYFFSYGVACMPKLPEPCSQEGKEEVNKKKKVDVKVNFDDNVAVIPDVKKPRKVPARKKTITTPLKRNVPRKAQATPKKAQATPKKAQATPKKAQATPKKAQATPKRDQAAPKKKKVATVRKTPTKKAQATPKKAQATPKKAQATPKRDQATPKRDQAAPKKGKVVTVRKTPTKKREDRKTVMKEKVVAEEEPLPAQLRRSSRHPAKNINYKE
ncbi:unnamed protein product [Caenorhabditis auriculariae]|uniref:RRM domain-containing protein n=1 Tax=Caenorhabditis auriculariae TaxID=2777116 RepID=A0A8S1H7C8_9PELO|nr:unnamed protein product [Caenorhabditis auriculariae]